MNRFKPLLFLLITVAWQATSALESDQAQPVYLEADQVEIDESKGISHYQGNVIISQGSMKLQADQMWIYRHKGRTEKIVATGNPTRFQQRMVSPGGSEADVTGRANKAELDLLTNELLLLGNALLQQGPNRFESDRIQFIRDQSLIKAGSKKDGQSRVKAVIEPKSIQQ